MSRPSGVKIKSQMKSVELWSDRVLDRDKQQQSMWDVCFNPDGSWLVVACGSKVFVYETAEGTLLQALKGHKDVVNCVAFAKDGKRFASGSADKTVIIWNDKLEGVLRYTHNDTIQSLAFNPLGEPLVSCTSSDFGFWTKEAKSVDKHKISSRITCCSWTNDGQYLALGQMNGIVSIRTKTGEEKVKIERSGPVWTLEWCPNKYDSYDTLAVGDWGQKLAFYHLSGRLVGKERNLGCDPCQLSWFPKGEFLVVSGSGKICQLYTKEGIKVGKVVEEQSWILCSKVHPSGNFVAIGTEDGQVSYHQLTFSVIHGLHKDRYAYRDNLTDVVIQHLITDQKVRIRCRDLVRRVATYKHVLAVQLSERVVIYQLTADDATDMQYRARDKFSAKIDSDILVLCSKHLIICMERRLQCLNFKGVKEREWVVESSIRYIRVTGGLPGREGLLIGLKNGQVLQIFIDNPFPVQMLKLNTSMRCLDINASRSKLAVVDDHNTCLVYNIKTKELLFQEPNATSVAWNSQHDDMLCFSGVGMLNIKVANFPVHQQKLQGFVVAFNGSNIYCLNGYAITTISVPQSASMYQYLEKKSFNNAYNVASLGVTSGDWDHLAHEALQSLDLNVAGKAFRRTRDIRYLNLISDIEERRRHGETNMNVFLADIFAHEGKFAEAARMYKTSGYPSKALNMYTDLRMFDLAKEFVGAEDVKEKKKLMTKQADWASNLNEPKSAAEMYINAGEFSKAIDIIGDHGWADMLIELARRLDKADEEPLRKSAEYLCRMEQFAYASEIYEKLGDMRALVLLHVEAKYWEEAFELAKKHPEYKKDVYLPYAQFLAESDKFEEAQMAFHKAGLEKEAVKVLEQLTHNAVTENRFDDAGYYFWKLSIQFLDLAAVEDDHSSSRSSMLGKFREYQHKAEMYYAYHFIQRFTEEPFTSLQPETLFNVSRFLWHCLQTMPEVPEGISKVATLYCLAKHSKLLGALKLARHAYEKLETLRVPARYQESAAMGAILIRGKAFHDSEDLLPLCYRCSTTNPLLNSQGNACVNCRQPFIFSFVAFGFLMPDAIPDASSSLSSSLQDGSSLTSYYRTTFELLPLIEFFIDPEITDVEAISLLELEPPNQKRQQKTREFKATITGDSQKIDEEYATMMDEKSAKSDPFNAKYVSFESAGEFRKIVCGRDVLRSMSRTEVMICEWPKPLRNQYYKIVMLDVSMTKCNSCNKIFHKDDYELLALQFNRCPYCRTPIEE